MKANEFNAMYPVGSRVSYWPPGRHDFISTMVTEPAFDIPEREHAMVWVAAAPHAVSVGYLVKEEQQ